MDNKIEIRYPKDTVLNIYPKPKRYLKNTYFRCFSEEAISLAVDKQLSGTDLRVLLAMLANLEFENIINISQQELEKQINISQANISKSIQKLISKGYLQIIDNIGRRNIYMFNPNIAFKTKAENLKEVKRAWDKVTFPNTQKPVDLDIDLEPDLEDKLDDKVEELSQKFKIPQSKVRQILLSLVNQDLENEPQEHTEVPY